MVSARATPAAVITPETATRMAGTPCARTGPTSKENVFVTRAKPLKNLPKFTPLLYSLGVAAAWALRLQTATWLRTIRHPRVHPDIRFA